MSFEFRSIIGDFLEFFFADRRISIAQTVEQVVDVSGSFRHSLFEGILCVSFEAEEVCDAEAHFSDTSEDFCVVVVAGRTPRVVGLIKLTAQIVAFGIFHKRRIRRELESDEIFTFFTFLFGGKGSCRHLAFGKAFEVVGFEPHLVFSGCLNGVLLEVERQFRQFCAERFILVTVFTFEVCAAASKRVVGTLQEHLVFGVELLEVAMLVDVFNAFPKGFVERNIG